MSYIISIHATQLNDGTLDVLWENESILEGDITGSSVIDLVGAESIQDVWATISNGLELTNEEKNSTFNAGVLRLYDQGTEAANTMTFINPELVLSITVIEVDNV